MICHTYSSTWSPVECVPYSVKGTIVPVEYSHICLYTIPSTGSACWQLVDVSDGNDS